MHKLFIIALILLATGANSAQANIDYNCAARCERQGNIAQVCWRMCSY